MKSKKLFAILTLVAFMMTLIPMAAFGAALPYSRTNSSVSASGTSVDDVYDATVTNAAKFTLTFKDAAKQVVTNQNVTFYVRTSNDLAVGWVEEDATPGTNDAYNNGVDQDLTNEMSTTDGQPITVGPDANGKVVFYLGSYVGTSFKVEVLDGADGNVIGSAKTVTVEKEAGAIDVKAYADEDDDAADDVTSFVAGDGFDVRADIGTGEDDVEVTFKQKVNNGSWVTIGTAVTDGDGIADIWVDATAAGLYVFRAVAGSNDGDSATITVNPSEADTIVLKSTPGTIALDKPKTVEVYVKDEAGNTIKKFDDASLVTYEFTAAPSGSEYEDQDGILDGNVPNDGGVNDYAGTTNRGVARFAFTPDELGTYTIKLKLESSDPLVDVGNDTETITFEAVKQSTITNLTFDLQNAAGDSIPAIRYLEDVAAGNDPKDIGKLDVKLVDAAGVKTTADNDVDLTFASSDPSNVSVDGNGILTVKDDEFTGTVTITATYDDDNLVGTYDVKVAGSPNSFTATPAVDGKKAHVALQLVDKAGNATISNNGDFVTKEAIKVTAPSGVIVSGIAKLDQAGVGAFDLTADQAGKYNITVTATVDGNAGYNEAARSISKTFAVEFVTPASEIPVIGAKSVTMFIGAPGYTQDGIAKVSDVAPFIQNGRTFVAVRPVAEAFGATAAYNEATKTVTLTRSDMTVTIVIGSPAITVVKGGVTSTVTADVAAFITNGRTVLPFRAVGDAFGAKVNYDAATQAVTYAQ